VVRGRFAGYGGFVALLILLALAPAIVPVPAAAEVAPSVTITASGSVLRNSAETQALPVVEASLELDSAGNRNVKGYFQLDSYVGQTIGIDIPQAYLKVRLPWFRLTLGKTRVSWGEGFVFNAGDVVFGSMEAISGDLSGSTLRSQTAWLGSVYVPLGAFSFLEAVTLPYGVPDPTLDTTTLTTDLADLKVPLPLHSLSGGIRGVFKLGRTTLETGYYATGRKPTEHRPYVSCHGHLLVDWNLSAAMGIPQFDTNWQLWDQFLRISAGMFHMVNLGLNRSLSFRLEAAVRPGADWEEIPDGADYALVLFPEISFSPSDTVSLELRSLISPVDLSALNLFGVSWNIYQGLTIFSYLSLPAGDGNDQYRWDQDMLTFWTTGLEFVY
jgi:hypothetical protein